MGLMGWVGGAPVLAAGLADRVMEFPQWTSPPPTRAAQGDLEYPDWFEGTWRATSTLVEQVAPLAPAVVTPGFEGNRQFLDQPIAFPVRFVRQSAPSLESPGRFFLLPSPVRPQPVVADRAFNGLHIAQAYLGESAVLGVRVNPQNPNEQVTELQGSSQLWSRVSDRATETPDPQTFLATEVSQQIFRSGRGSFLNIVETTTVYAYQIEALGIEAEQYTAVYLSPQDPDYFKAGDRPVALYHYHLRLDPLDAIDNF